MNDQRRQPAGALDALLAGYSQDILALKEDVAKLYGHVETLQDQLASLAAPAEEEEGDEA